MASAYTFFSIVLSTQKHYLQLPLLQDEVFTVFSKVALSPKEVCGILLGPPCGDSYNPWDQEWNISVPGNKPPVTPIPPPKVCTGSIQYIPSIKSA